MLTNSFDEAVHTGVMVGTNIYDLRPNEDFGNGAPLISTSNNRKNPQPAFLCSFPLLFDNC